MARSFRFEPPQPRDDALLRARLLQILLGRWRHRVTALVGGPGLGKTTLLAQAVAENRLAPRGDDVWIGINAHDADQGALPRVVAEALARHAAAATSATTASATTARTTATVTGSAADTAGTATGVADAIWRRSPTQVCLVLDDVHLLPEGSDGARWLAELLDMLPANGHVVLISRSEPTLPLARLRSHGQVLDLGEDELRFTEGELATFAVHRGLSPAQLHGTGGWPALAELASMRETRHAGEYLWEEVLAPLGDERRHILSVLCEIGGADSELVSAALATPVDLGRVVDGIPLVAHDADGWYVPHMLWRNAPGIGLPESERDAVRSRAVAHLTRRGRIDSAFSLVRETGSWHLAPQVLRAACLASDRLTSYRLKRWLAETPEEVRTSPAGRLAVALQTAFTAPADATEPLRQAALELRAEDDVDAELIAITELGKLTWWRQDPLTIDIGFVLRVGQLGADGHAGARALAALGTAMFADVGGNDDAVLAALDSVGPGRFPDPAWEMHAGWLEAITRIDLGEPEAALRIIERFEPPLDRVSRAIYDTARLTALWFMGRIDQVLEEMPAALERGVSDGVGAHSYVGLGGASILCSLVGDVAKARRCLDDIEPVMPPASVDKPPPLIAVMRAALLLAEGDEEQATTILRDAIQNFGVEKGTSRRVWRLTLALSYVLVEDIRSHWDAAPLRGHLATARELARLVVGWRTGAGREQLAAARLPEVGIIRAVLHHRLAAELAVGLHTAGRSEGPALLEALGPVGREAVRALTAGRSRQAKQAKALLTALPVPPSRPTYVRALGSLAVHRDGWDGEEVTDPILRRKRVRELLSFLAGHRTTTRGMVMAALWPDLDEETTGNNLAVTLSYLLRVLEPWRPPGEPAFLVRVDGQAIRLVTGDQLNIDVDEFDRHIAAAAEAEEDGMPSVALTHHLAAVELYRGELYADLPETSWLALDREHYCTRFVSAATRAGQLLLGRGDRGDVDRAEHVARRVVETDPWAEEAHGVLIGAALARGDRSAARRRLQHCLAALADLDVPPSDTTRQLQRRVEGDDAALRSSQ